MEITLTPATQQLIQEHLKTRRYPSVDALLQAALHALEDLHPAPLDESTLDAIDRAEDQIERGEVQDWQAVRERVRAKFLGTK